MDMMNRRSFFSHRQPSQQRSRTQSSRPPIANFPLPYDFCGRHHRWGWAWEWLGKAKGGLEMTSRMTFKVGF